MTYRWFSPEKDPLMVGLSAELMSKLDTARTVLGLPLIISGGLRNCAANAAVMGAEHSAHIQGLAADLGLGHLAEGYDRDNARILMIKALLSAGFVRMGLYSAHIHVDVGQSPDYVQEVAWFTMTA